MLQLKDIVKNYEMGDSKVEALKGISINFRKSEFVSVLGQSGCGKTTLLNIIGGLDGYSSGDLIINGKSTKKFKDADWDTYRNHSIGFVFQSYNLIPHQSVLANVELALTLSGVSPSERKKRASAALERVGLGDQLHKKPNQMSGGQMQRVAIARALVNEPDILLADEPTGALDSETSVQIMELLKEISKDRLIIMVTHNPDLAETYSTRIIRLLDGRVVDDSRPYDGYIDEDVNSSSRDKGKRASMSFMTALGLSANNLWTKKGRTFLTAFAGAIGIIGIALILSLSDGFQKYIDRVQEETLSNYPITIESETMDFSALFSAMGGEREEKEEKDETTDKASALERNVIKSLDVSTNMYNAMVSKRNVNDLAEFKKFIDNEENGVQQLVSAIRYTYDLNVKIYGTDLYGDSIRVNPSTVMDSMGMGNMSSVYSMYSSMPAMSMMGTDMDIFGELIDNPDLLAQQYDVIAGHWPRDKTEMVFVVSGRNYVEDMALFTLGLKDQSTLSAFLKNEAIEKSGKDEYSYDDILGLRFRCILDSDYYSYDPDRNEWRVIEEDSEQFKAVLENGLELKIAGIVRPKPEAAATAISGTIGYTKDLTEYIINETNNSAIVRAQRADIETDVFTGKPFSDSENAEAAASEAMDLSTLTPEQQAYLASLSEEELENLRKQMAASAVSNATYEGNLKALGVCDLSVPSSISIYPKDFESKDLLENKIKEYNEKCEAEGREGEKISYTDFIGLMMSSISTIINAITYVLIAFVAISLVVSSIMIAIITYISVLERTKEIGILRSIGASKKDVSRVFNAETLIEGFVSGGLGVLVTVLLNIPINAIIYHFAGLKNISALPVKYALILILISIILTVIAGLIPAGMAAKRDPVEALRSE
jgi:putative ABC transport system permease protein